MGKLFVGVALLAALFLAQPTPTGAGGLEQLNVTTTADTFDGACDQADCSLRDALDVANADINETFIQLPAGTIVISSTALPDFGTFEIDTDITINGQGMDLTTISGDQIATVFTVTQEGDGILRNLGITLGVGQLAGGILAVGPVTLDSVRVFVNANMGGGGAGISAFESLLIEDSFITDNLSPNGVGGIAVRDAIIRGSVISDNASTGPETAVGGIASQGEVTIEDSVIAGNRAMGKTGAGGIVHSGLQIIPFGGEPFDPNTLTLNRVTLSENTFTTTGLPGDPSNPAGGIASSGQLLATDINITGNVLDQATPEVTGFGAGGLATTRESETWINRGAFTSNTSFSGAGGLFLQGSDNQPASGQGPAINQLTNVTISGNETTNGAGGLLASDALAIVAATIANNTGGGGFQGVEFGGGILVNEQTTILGSIIADNEPMNCGGFFAQDSNPTSLGYNIDSRESCDFGGVGDRINTDPLLTPLHDNGGDAGDTHRLGVDSPALDSWPTCPLPTLDQRKEGRPNGGMCDVGAYELAEDDENIETLWADHNCGGSLNAADIVLALFFEANQLREIAPAPQGGGRPCPQLGWEIAADAFAKAEHWGDVDCNGLFDGMDILVPLYELADVSFTQPQGCPHAGDPITLR